MQRDLWDKWGNSPGLVILFYLNTMIKVFLDLFVIDYLWKNDRFKNNA